MALLAPNEGEILLLQYMVNMVASNNAILHLYVNDYTPVEASAFANFSETGLGGYAPLTLAGANWTTQLSGNTAFAIYSEQTFTFTTGISVYGYFLTNNANTKVLWAERFSGAPFTLPATGGAVSINPRGELD